MVKPDIEDFLGEWVEEVTDAEQIFTNLCMREGKILGVMKIRYLILSF